MTIGKPQLIIESNSIGLGYYADNNGPPNYLSVGSPPFPDGWATLMQTALGGSSVWDMTNNSIDGGKTTDITAADPSVGYPLLSATRLANVVFFLEVTNDWASSGLIAQCLTHYQSWYNGWRSASHGTGVGGNTIIIFGIPLPQNGTFVGTWDPDRLWMRQQVQALGQADEFCDFGLDAIMGAGANLYSATYYRPIDRIHPLLAGHAILAKMATATVNRAMKRMAFVWNNYDSAVAAQQTIDTATGYPLADPLAGGAYTERSEHYAPVRGPDGAGNYSIVANPTTVAALASSSPPQPVFLPPTFGF
jgi:hypothetical protein